MPGSLARARSDPRSPPNRPRRRREGQRAKLDGEPTACVTRGHVLVASFNQLQMMGAATDDHPRLSSTASLSRGVPVGVRFTGEFIANP
jgi:hypothetical protein